MGNFHWLNLASNMVTKVGDIHRRDEDSPYKRDMRVPWAMATGNMRRKFILNMGGRVDNVVLLDRGLHGEAWHGSLLCQQGGSLLNQPGFLYRGASTYGCGWSYQWQCCAT